MSLLGIKITDQSVMERLEKCQPWLQDLVSKMLELPASLATALATKQQRLLIADMTDVVGPGAKGSQWRVHLVVDAPSLQLVEVNISDYHTVESLRLINVRTGDLILGDRAYCRRDAIFETIAAGAEIVVRYHHTSVPIYSLTGEKIDLIKHFRKQARETSATSQVIINSNQGEERRVWLHSYRLSKKEAAIAKKKTRYKNRKVKRGVSDLTLFISEFVIVLSTIAPSQLSGMAVLALYRCRWQIEIVIKRFKSLLSLDKLRTRLESSLAQVWLYGKMLYVLLVENAARAVEVGAYQLAFTRVQTPWRVLKLLRHCINTLITACRDWADANWQAALRVLSERKRKRTLQLLPSEVRVFLNNSVTLPNAA